MIEAIKQDVTYALRGLRRSPGLTAAILVTFALGVGVNAALFTVIDRVFFQAPAGVVDPGAVRRLIIHSQMVGGTQIASGHFTTKDITHFREVAAGAAQIDGFDAVEGRSIGNDPQKRTVGYATSGFFSLVGVRAQRGRFFTADENQIGDPRYVAVVSYDYWRTALGADSALVGRTLRVDSAVFTVVGIAPPKFEGLDLDVVDVWLPLATMPGGMEGSPLNGSFDIVQLFARLAPDTDPRALETRLNVQFRRDRPFVLERDSTIRLEMAPLLQARSALGLGRQNDRNVALITRLGGVGFMVLVVAVTNVASLLLMRALRRRREIAIRIALGISRRRLAGQLVVESMMLAAIGGVVALVLAQWSGALLRNLLLANVRWPATVIDGRLIAFTMFAAILAGIIAGFAPAAVALRRDIMKALKSGTSESGRSRSPVRAGLLVTQTALCMLMLASAGVFLQSLRQAANFDLGFDADRLIRFQLFRIDENVGDEALQRIRALPSVASVSRHYMDFRGGSFLGIRSLNGDSIPLMQSPTGGFTDTAYASATGMRVLSGRYFNAGDVKGSEPVIVINQAMADQYWRGRSPIGDCIRNGPASEPCKRIVGVVGSFRWEMTAPPPRMYYMPAQQAPFPRCCNGVIVRTRGPATAANVAEIRRIVANLPGGVREFPPTPRLVTERLEPQLKPWRIGAASFFVFGILALAAAAAGIYGLVGYDVTQRTHEFGVRITLGSTSSGILRLVVASGLRVVAVGLVAGAISALVGGRLISSLLFETSPYDPTVLVATAIALAVVALLASLVPAWRATRVDPVVALRAE